MPHVSIYARAIVPTPAASIPTRIRPWEIVLASVPLGAPAGRGPLLPHAVNATVTQTSKDVRYVLSLHCPFDGRAFQSTSSGASGEPCRCASPRSRRIGEASGAWRSSSTPMLVGLPTRDPWPPADESRDGCSDCQGAWDRRAPPRPAQ